MFNLPMISSLAAIDELLSMPIHTTAAEIVWNRVNMSEFNRFTSAIWGERVLLFGIE